MYLSDLHTHTIASGHGTACTIADLAKEASARGLRLLGISDHGPATTGAGTESYFRSLTYAPAVRCGIGILYGAECNILDFEGRLDLPDEVINRLDFAIASLHRQNIKPSSREDNTRAVISAMKHPGIKIAGHLDDTHYPLDYEAVVLAAREYHVLPEVNEASLAPDGYRGDTRANLGSLLAFCQRHRVPVILSSDSHGRAHVGDFTLASAFLHETGFPESLVMNNRISELKGFLSASL